MSTPPLQENQDLMKEIRERLAKTEQRATDVISSLEKHQKIQESIDSASISLTDSSTSVFDLSEKAKQAIEVLFEALTTFQKATDMLSETNSAELLNKLDSIIQSTETINSTIDQVLKQLEKDSIDLKEKFDSIHSDVLKYITDGQDALKEFIQSEIAQVVKQQQKDTSTLTKKLDSIHNDVIRYISEGQDTLKNTILSEISQVSKEQKDNTTTVGKKLLTQSNILKKLSQGQSDINETIDSNSEKIVKRLRPRNRFEGTFGKLSDY
ncbi:MAG: hypothetical protein OXF84_06030 [Bacteroidetes bacterium]|nr:hypothetical protein [Bacteroidota bacterium]